MTRTKKKTATKGESFNALRFHLDGTVEVSSDFGQTWHAFQGVVINAALVEYSAEINHMRREGAMKYEAS